MHTPWTPKPGAHGRGPSHDTAPRGPLHVTVPLAQGHVSAPGKAQSWCVPSARAHTHTNTSLPPPPPTGPLQLPGELISTNAHACWGKDLINSPLGLRRGAKAQGRPAEAGPLSPPSGHFPGVGEASPVRGWRGPPVWTADIYRHLSHALRRMHAYAQTCLAVAPHTCEPRVKNR